MRYFIACMLIIFSYGSRSEEVLLTPHEENVIVSGLELLRDKFDDPEWIEAILAGKGNGCWLDKETFVNEGTQADFAGIASTCVSYNIFLDPIKSFLFIPTRVKYECDTHKLEYVKCARW